MTNTNTGRTLMRRWAGATGALMLGLLGAYMVVHRGPLFGGGEHRSHRITDTCAAVGKHRFGSSHPIEFCALPRRFAACTA